MYNLLKAVNGSGRKSLKTSSPQSKFTQAIVQFPTGLSYIGLERAGWKQSSHQSPSRWMSCRQWLSPTSWTSRDHSLLRTHQPRSAWKSIGLEFESRAKQTQFVRWSSGLGKFRRKNQSPVPLAFESSRQAWECLSATNPLSQHGSHECTDDSSFEVRTESVCHSRHLLLPLQFLLQCQPQLLLRPQTLRIPRLRRSRNPPHQTFTVDFLNRQDLGVWCGPREMEILLTTRHPCVLDFVGMNTPESSCATIHWASASPFWQWDVPPSHIFSWTLAI